MDGLYAGCCDVLSLPGGMLCAEAQVGSRSTHHMLQHVPCLADRSQAEGCKCVCVRAVSPGTHVAEQVWHARALALFRPACRCTHVRRADSFAQGPGWWGHWERSQASYISCGIILACMPACTLVRQVRFLDAEVNCGCRGSQSACGRVS